MPRFRLDDLNLNGDLHVAPDDRQRRRSGRPRTRDLKTGLAPADTWKPASRKQRRADGQESFKCGRCRAFIGPTVSGGRHRNHCPLCLHSRHVDDTRPGDRASGCRSLMEPIGVFHRPKGEQVLLHRCLGCGLERHNRVAADDNPLAMLRLPPVPPRLGGAGRIPIHEEEAIA